MLISCKMTDVPCGQEIDADTDCSQKASEVSRNHGSKGPLPQEGAGKYCPQGLQFLLLNF